MKSTGGLFSWFRSAPLTQREVERQERLDASRRLQDPANLHLKYAQWREHLGDLADARQSYQFALKENPKSLEAKLGLARLDQLAGRTTEAEEGFQNALKSRPGDPQALNALGQFYASQKQWGKALPLLEDAADAAPNEPSYRHHLAVGLAQSGDLQAAFTQFQRVLGEAEAHYNIGYLLFEQGHKQMAMQRVEQALAINPHLKQAQALLEEIEGPAKDVQLAAATAAAGLPKTAVEPVSNMKYIPVETVRTPPTVEPTKWRPLANRGNEAPKPLVQQHASATPEVPASPTVPLSPAVPANPPGRAAASATPTEPVAPPTWRKHREVSPTRQQGENYLPPYEGAQDSTTPPSSGTQTSTPPITPAQREQWENQSRAQAQ